MNTFIALEIPPHIQEQLEAYAHKVHARLDRQGMKWVRKEKYHITLCFLGQVESTDAILASIEPVLAEAKEVQLEIGEINSFPDTKRPGVLWVGVDNDGSALSSLQSGLATALASEDVFVPHITLSRMKPPSTKLGHKLRDFMHSGPVPEIDTWVSDTVSLVVTRADGSYENVKSFKLKR